jgi:hypothetical protein
LILACCWLAHARPAAFAAGFHLDFEDGYGNRSDAEEDGHAESAAVQVATALKNGTLPPFIGIRIKNLGDELRERSLRTTRLFMDRMLKETGGQLPPNFAITLSKITGALTRNCSHRPLG